MTPVELCKELGGYANFNKLIVKHNGKPQYLARLVGHEYEFTELGKTLVAEYNAKKTVGLTEGKPKTTKKKKSRRTKAQMEAAQKVDVSFDESKINVSSFGQDVDSEPDAV